VKVPDEPAVDVEEAGLAVEEPATHAAGLKVVRISLTRALKQMRPVKSTRRPRAAWRSAPGSPISTSSVVRLRFVDSPQGGLGCV
jgi:hypothetical protein